MKTTALILCAVGMLVTEHVFGQPPIVEDKEALEIGGVVTLDYKTQTDALETQNLEIGKVELSAVVNVNEQVNGVITLLAEGNLSEIRIDQALADLKPSTLPLEFLFGQQTLNFGMMSTRLISDPLGLDLVAPTQPGITGLYTFGNVTAGLACLMTDRPVASPKYVVTTAGDTVELPSDDAAGKRSIGGVVNIDYAFLDESLLRLSTFLSQDKVCADLACNAGLGKFTLDAEFFSSLYIPHNEAREGTYTAGIAYDLTDIITIAFRHDGLSDDRLKDLTMRYAIGASVALFGDCFAAFEYGYEKPAHGGAINTIALQLGLESMIKVPGFQRKTLTRE